MDRYPLDRNEMLKCKELFFGSFFFLVFVKPLDAVDGKIE